MNEKDSLSGAEPEQLKPLIDMGLSAMIDTTIAHYQITAMIGKGGMGEVFRATDTKLDRDVAVKILPKSLRWPPAVTPGGFCCGAGFVIRTSIRPTSAPSSRADHALPRGDPLAGLLLP